MKEANGSYSVRIRNTTFIACLKQLETAKKPLDTAFHDLCIHEALGGFFPAEKIHLKKCGKPLDKLLPDGYSIGVIVVPRQRQYPGSSPTKER